jgi:hypothetical protein
MTMLNLTPDRRAMLADKLPDVASLAAGALFFGQFLGDRPFSWPLAEFGITSWLVLIGCAYVLAGGTAK